MSHQDDGGLRVLLLPVSAAAASWDLLLPAAAVAELVRAPVLDAPSLGAPDWLSGYLAWRGLRVPVVRPLGVRGPTGGRDGHTYAAVCFAPGGTAAVPFFAIAGPQMPRLERITPQTLSPDPHPADAAECPFIQVALRILDRPAGLVDLDAVERALLATLD